MHEVYSVNVYVKLVSAKHINTYSVKFLLFLVQLRDLATLGLHCHCHVIKLWTESKHRTTMITFTNTDIFHQHSSVAELTSS